MRMRVCVCVCVCVCICVCVCVQKIATHTAGFQGGESQGGEYEKLGRGGSAMPS
jgi:hypothetical protein